MTRANGMTSLRPTQIIQTEPAGASDAQLLIRSKDDALNEALYALF